MPHKRRKRSRLPYEVKDRFRWRDLPRRLLCDHGLHVNDRSRWIEKFNGGNGAFLCPRCHLILAYGHDRYTTDRVN